MVYEMAKLPPWWLRGRPADFWLKHSQVVQEFIKQAALKPVDQKFLVTKLEVMVPQAPQAVATATVRGKITSPDIRGGIRLAHLHFRDDVYILNDEQWGAFSKRIVEDFSAKLAKASTVSFDQLLDLSEAVDTLQP